MARSRGIKRWLRRDRGATAAEAALVLPVILMVLFGIIDFGRLVNAQIVVSQAAREGARAEAVGADAGVRANDAAQNMGPVDTNVLESCGDEPDPEDHAHVVVTFEFHFVTPVVALAKLAADTVTLDGHGVMPCRG
ncbi:TadE/TadG family type IV pilus assembly protein [Phytohabitans aurantiacus]|uniref:TadE/TadG family type IV pilus assembly protein n=1 Tax=Phytohabitans aurantiacus TaxID=3016789 RepID=UPI00249332F9|nr:TadE/TadG family type IV pilus assembly protein [Phytohabitans aurantiacus]